MENKNLYRDPEYKCITEQCRRLLLEWLINTMRVTTVWAPNNSSSDPFEIIYPTAGDGKESNTAGAALRVRKGQINYI